MVWTNHQVAASGNTFEDTSHTRLLNLDYYSVRKVRLDLNPTSFFTSWSSNTFKIKLSIEGMLITCFLVFQSFKSDHLLLKHDMVPLCWSKRDKMML